MRIHVALITALVSGFLWVSAEAAPSGRLTLYYTGNTWGYLLPCPG